MTELQAVAHEIDDLVKKGVKLEAELEEVKLELKKEFPDPDEKARLRNLEERLASHEKRLAALQEEKTLLTKAAQGTANRGGLAGPSEAGAQEPRSSGAQEDLSPGFMAEFLGALPPLTDMPSTANELYCLAADRTAFKIPLPASDVEILRKELSAGDMDSVKAVSGYHSAVAKLAILVLGPPEDLGSEMTSTVAVINLFTGVFNLMTKYSTASIILKARANKTEKGAGSSSQAVGPKLQPDELFVCRLCTLLLCEDKEERLDLALAQLQKYCQGGLPASHYGPVPGIPALATADLVVNLCFVPKVGEVSSTDMQLDLRTVGGRLVAVCCAINLYRLFVLLSQRLPRMEKRKPLWAMEERGDATVMLTPTGAEKHIPRWKAYAEKAGTSQAALEKAYEAAAAAASQLPAGKRQFLVTASSGPTVSARRGYEVHTQPLGFYKVPQTEQECQHLGWACCKALMVLHGVGITHTDIRPENTVWLAEDAAMLIDLEHCRMEDKALPADLKLSGWDHGTLQEDAPGQKRYTFSSDMYSLGQMLRQMLTVMQGNHSAGADDFIRQLLAKELTATQALSHAWLLGLA